MNCGRPCRYIWIRLNLLIWSLRRLVLSKPVSDHLAMLPMACKKGSLLTWTMSIDIAVWLLSGSCNDEHTECGGETLAKAHAQERINSLMSSEYSGFHFFAPLMEACICAWVRCMGWIWDFFSCSTVRRSWSTRLSDWLEASVSWLADIIVDPVPILDIHLD